MRNREGVVDSYHLSEIFKATAEKLGGRCGATAVEVLARRLIDYIGAPEDDKYSHIWRSAIEDHEQDAHRDDTRVTLVTAVRDAALGATNINTGTAEAALKLLLKSPYPTLNRIGIYVCGECYGKVGTVFWENVEIKWFIDSVYWHEIYWFIRKSFQRFSTTERNKFITIIESINGSLSDDRKQKELHDIHRRNLLHPAFGKGDSEIDEKYQDLVRKLGDIREHPDFHTYSEMGWAGDRSPISSDSIVGMSDADMVAFLKGFLPDNRAFNGPTYRGLASSISAATRASEDGFSQRILLFSDLSRPCQHGLLRGLKERWAEDKRDIDWSATLSLLHSIVSSPNFIADLAATPQEGWEPSVYWVISDIADLIKAASGKERKIPKEMHQPCLKILQIILDSTVPAEASSSYEAVSQAINSYRGKTLESLIHLALAMRREEASEVSDSNTTWKAIEPILESELRTSELGLNADFSALSGMYCINFSYLNKDWTEANFDRIFSSTNSMAWECAAQGFSYQRHFYDWLFKRLSTGGHLRKMIYSKSLPNQVTERALQFLGLAYLNDLEDINSQSLLNEMISTLRIDGLSHLCWFFWTLRGTAEAATYTQKIMEFWIRTGEQAHAMNARLPEMQSSLSQLAVFIPNLNPIYVSLLLEAAPHAHAQHHGPILLDNLLRLARDYPKEVAEIYRAAISGVLLEYPKEDVIELVRRIAEAGEVDEAEWICNAYAQKGSTLLKSYYETLRARQREIKDLPPASEF